MDAALTQLSSSSRDALRFAWAAALERAALSDGDPQVSPSDLLIGILLSIPGTSEAEQTFRHYGLVAGQALPEGYPRLTATSLNQHLESTDLDADPPFSSEVQNIIGQAISVGARTDPNNVAPLRALWAALLMDTNEASAMIRDLLARRGVNPSGFVREVVTWVGAGPSGGEYKQLLERHSATPAAVVNYKSDQAAVAARSTEAAVPDDFVGVGAEIDAFAYLLASRAIEPPLAVGLFGEWGSGKSYFLDGIRRRIDQLLQSEEAKRDQRDVLFWKRIVQVEFNAWHYVEGDLWSSLVDQILRNLSISERDSETVVMKRQRYLMAQLKTTTEELTQLQTKKNDIEIELEQQKQAVTRAEGERDKAIEALEQVKAKRIADEQARDSAGAVWAALRKVKLADPSSTKKNDAMTLGDAAETLIAARAELERGESLLLPFATQPRLLFKLVAFVLVSLAVVVLIERGLGSSAGGALAGLTALAATAVGALRTATQWLKSGLDEIDRAKRTVDAEFAAAKAKHDEEIKEAQRAVDEKNQELERIRERQQELRDNLEETQKQLDKSPTELLSDFLRERIEAGEYAKRLGVPAMIRRDFKSLAELISHQNRYLLETRAEERKKLRDETPGILKDDDAEEIINRIVLYIDDLDRCPDWRVIEVLQAVHMLLAFPLFIVVVAVDSRWLANALQSRFPALAGPPATDGAETARPDDYLEKIFQIPFWVQQLDDDARSNIVRGLLGGHVYVEAQDSGGAGNGKSAEIGPEGERVLREMVDPRRGPPLPDIRALTVTRDELDFLDSLAPLMGRTPRSVKRFVNVYQLVKILRSGRGGAVNDPSDEQLAAFLLAVAEGTPEVGSSLFERAAAVPADTPLAKLIEDRELLKLGAGLQRVKDWIDRTSDSNPGSPWQLVPSQRITALASDVKRFVFRPGPSTGPPIGSVRPQLVHVIHDRDR